MWTVPRRGLDAVEAAAAEAAIRHRPLRIVHALVWPVIGFAFAPGTTGSALQAIRDQADDIVSEASLVAAKVAPDVPVTAEVLTGPPGQVLRDESRAASLLVLGDRGLGGFSAPRRVVLASTVGPQHAAVALAHLRSCHGALGRTQPQAGCH